MQYLLEWGFDKHLCQDYMWIRKRKPEDKPLNNRNLWNKKQIRKLLLIVTIADLKQFTDKNKSNTYIGTFIELYNWKNRGQVHEIYGMV